MKTFRHILFYVVISIISATALVSCDLNPVSSIPERMVSLQINTRTEGNFVHFQPSCWQEYVIADDKGWHYKDFPVVPYAAKQGAHGYGGVVIFVTGSETNPYASFDLACPYCYLHTGKCAPTRVDGFKAICDQCQEEYNLAFFGQPQKGKSKESLRRYTTTYSAATGIIFVRN